MTPEQSAAFIQAQTALLNVRLAGMRAENQQRDHRGESVCYDEAAFQELYDEFDGVLGHNSVIMLFNDGR